MLERCGVNSPAIENFDPQYLKKLEVDRFQEMKRITQSFKDKFKKGNFY